MCMCFAKQTNSGRPPNFDSICTPISSPVFSLFQKCDQILFEISTPSIVYVTSFRRVGGRGAHGPRALGRCGQGSGLGAADSLLGGLSPK